MVEILSQDDVMGIHDALTAHFKESDDPISPPGIKNLPLLESAIARQTVGYGGVMKYPDPHFNAATLVYGICMNHAFHNGNKRAAFVAGLVHLDRNDYVPGDVTEAEFYDLMLHLARHKLPELKGDIAKRVVNGYFRKAGSKWTPDMEVEFLARWMDRCSRKMTSRIKTIRLKDLKKVFREHGCEVIEGKNETWVRRHVPRRLFGHRKLETRIPNVQDKWMPDPPLLRRILDDLDFTRHHGFDDDAFFHFRYRVDMVLHDYRNVLKRLAKT